jgi:hypothetical protein
MQQSDVSEVRNTTIITAINGGSTHLRNVDVLPRLHGAISQKAVIFTLST